MNNCVGRPANLQVIEEMISMQQPAMRVIRLLCLQSMADVGIKSSKYEFLKKEIVQVSSARTPPPPSREGSLLCDMGVMLVMRAMSVEDDEG